MTSFRDAAGREWSVAINVGSVRRVREAMDFDIQALADDHCQALGALLADPVKMAAVLWHLCKEQAASFGVSEDDFYAAMFGETLDAAGEAFADAFFAFGRKPMRVLGKKVFRKAQEVEAASMEMNAKLLDQIEAASLAERSTDSSGGPPAS